MATATAPDRPVEVTPDGPPPEDRATEEPTDAPRATRFRAVLLGLLALALVVAGATALSTSAPPGTSGPSPAVPPTGRRPIARP